MYEVIIIAVGIISLIFIVRLILSIKKLDAGTPKMREVSDIIRESATVYLHRQHKTISIFASALAVFFAMIFGFFISPKIGLITSLSFILGLILSAFTGHVGMKVALQANVKTANIARSKESSKAFITAFRGGAVTGLLLVALSLLGLYLLYRMSAALNTLIYSLLGFGVGASLDGLFMRVGGGIYTKAADMGADFVGKVEKRIPEDDPRNPAVIADLVGDNVGDVAGMGADVFESCTGSLIAAMLVGAILTQDVKFVIFPLVIFSVGILSCIVGMLLMEKFKDTSLRLIINEGLLVACILVVVAGFILTLKMLNDLNIFYSTLCGIATAVLISLTTQHYTSPTRSPTQALAEASRTGPATTILAGLVLGMKSTVFPVFVVCASMFLAYCLAGIYGVAMASVGMQCLAGMIVAMDSYGPITDNASGITEMSGLEQDVRDIMDGLDSIGNTTKAMCKGFAIGDAVFESLALFFLFMLYTKLPPEVMSLTNLKVVIGLLIGGVTAFLFSALCLNAVSVTAFKMIDEVRRQFREIPGLIEGKTKPDYARCVDISTHAALRNLLGPGFLSICAPLVVGFTLGAEAVAGMLIGMIVCSLLLAIMMAHAGTAWDNAKKFIEAGHLGGKGSHAHAAAVIGDTVGDPFKDTAGPSLDVMLTLSATVAIMFAALFVMYAILA